MATVYRRRNYRLAKAECTVTPKIFVSKVTQYNDMDQGIVLYDFGCLNYKYKPINAIHQFCISCQHRDECEINSEKFWNYYFRHSVCPKCHKHNLSGFYVYLLWKLKDFIDSDKRECCYCRGEKE